MIVSEGISLFKAAVLGVIPKRRRVDQETHGHSLVVAKCRGANVLVSIA